MNKNTGVFLTTVWIQTWMIFPRTDTLVFVGDAKASSTVFTSAGGMQNGHTFSIYGRGLRVFGAGNITVALVTAIPSGLQMMFLRIMVVPAFNLWIFFHQKPHIFDHFGTVCSDSVHQLSLFLLVIDISCCWVTTKDFHCQFLWEGRVSHNCFHYCSKVCVRTL